MNSVYLCLTCFKVSAQAGECHAHPMIRCGNSGPNGAATSALESGYHEIHWLVQTITELQQGTDRNVN